MVALRRSSRAVLLFALCLLAVCGPPAAAQEITGTITGIVRDSTGAVLPGVTITATLTGRGLTKEAISTETGVYTLPFLPVGTYDLVFSLAGFQTYTAKGIELHVNDRLEVNGTLTVGGVTESIEVVAVSPLVQATPQVQSLMGPTQVQELPLNNRRRGPRIRGLLVGVRHDQGRAGLINVAYTLSQTKTDASNDRDAVDLPQNPLDLEAEYAVARTDRTHVLTFNYVYELPFFRESNALLKATAGGWQVSGITQMWSGPPISRVVNGATNGSRRGIRVSELSDPFQSVPQDVAGGHYYFNPLAFAAPADGTYGNTGRAIFRLPGVHQWDITMSKNWYPGQDLRIQFRADFINAFNHTQFDPGAIQNVCTAGADLTCTTAGRLGQITNTRAPREIQLGLRLMWH
jgi:hypothetical protein